MVVRDDKGKPRKKAKMFGKQSKPETLLTSKLQDGSLKVHGDPLDPPKRAPAKTKGK
jgi:hypothetical protein